MANTGICPVDGCGKNAHTRGYCSAHYRRWLRHGDPNSGHASPGAGLRWLESHLAHDGEDCLIWPFGRLANGYAFVRRQNSGSVTTAARLKCEKVHGLAPSELHDAAHSCGKGHEACVHPQHLSWKTPTENHADKYVHGTMVRGEAVKHAKLTEDNVREIRTLAGTASQRVIGKKFGVSAGTIRRVILRLDWGWLK